MRVEQKQAAQKSYHAKFSRNITLEEGDSVMIWNYLPGKKWVPAAITQKTGPVSYKCQLESGAMTKRHADQIIPRSPKESRDASQSSEEREVPSGASPAPAMVVPERRGSPITLASPAKASPVLRKSSRRRRPVVKLDL